MSTQYDERLGLVKTCWRKIRKRVAKVEPRFAQLVDQINPDDSYPIFMAYYPYGAIEADTNNTLLPNADGTYFRLNQQEAPPEVFKHLGYGANSSPFGMVLEKILESFVDLPKDKITIPWSIYTPGKFFPFNRILSYKKPHVYAPNGLLSSSAGARSTFMLANVGCHGNHGLLKRDLGIKAPVPKNLYDQFAVFKDISDSFIKENQNDWRCCVLYFSEKWIEKIHSDDTAWLPLKKYLHEIAWDHFDYLRNKVFYDCCFSLIQKNRNLKPNPYLVDTAKHLFAIALGAAPGFIPALDEEASPIHLIQEAYLQYYGLKKYYPTIMTPAYFNFETDSLPTYYSLQHPSTYIFSPRSRDATCTLYELRELEHIIKIFKSELSKDHVLCSDTILGESSKEIQFDFYHNKTDRYGLVKLSDDIIQHDERFLNINKKFTLKNGVDFSAASTFLRGCVKISRPT